MDGLQMEEDMGRRYIMDKFKVTINDETIIEMDVKEGEDGYSIMRSLHLPDDVKLWWYGSEYLDPSFCDAFWDKPKWHLFK